MDGQMTEMELLDEFKQEHEKFLCANRKLDDIAQRMTATANVLALGHRDDIEEASNKFVADFDERFLANWPDPEIIKQLIEKVSTAQGRMETIMDDLERKGYGNYIKNPLKAT